MSRYRILLITIALQILRAALPGLRRRAAATPTPVDDAIISIIEQLLELDAAGELRALLTPGPPP